jgi:hypothetical protein
MEITERPVKKRMENLGGEITARTRPMGEYNTRRDASEVVPTNG